MGCWWFFIRNSWNVSCPCIFVSSSHPPTNTFYYACHLNGDWWGRKEALYFLGRWSAVQDKMEKSFFDHANEMKSLHYLSFLFVFPTEERHWRIFSCDYLSTRQLHMLSHSSSFNGQKKMFNIILWGCSLWDIKYSKSIHAFTVKYMRPIFYRQETV